MFRAARAGVPSWTEDSKSDFFKCQDNLKTVLNTGAKPMIFLHLKTNKKVVKNMKNAELRKYFVIISKHFIFVDLQNSNFKN